MSSDFTLDAALADHRFCCLGAAHLDHIMQLPAPPIYGRTNPVRSRSEPGGVAYNIAATLGRLGLRTTLCCAPAPRQVSTAARRLGIGLRALDAPKHECSYVALINEDGELEIGLAAMDAYDQITAPQLPEDFPFSRRGTVFIDAAFDPKLIKLAAEAARAAGCTVVGAGTSPAKVRKLAGFAWDLLTLNEAEAAALLDDSRADRMAVKLAHQTGGTAAVTCGAQGALLAAGDMLLRQAPPPFSAQNANGAGDAFAAALAAALAANANFFTALRLATAAGAAASTNERGPQNAKQFLAALGHAYRHTPPGMRLRHGSWQTVPAGEYQPDGCMLAGMRS